MARAGMVIALVMALAIIGTGGQLTQTPRVMYLLNVFLREGEKDAVGQCGSPFGVVVSRYLRALSLIKACGVRLLTCASKHCRVVACASLVWPAAREQSVTNTDTCYCRSVGAQAAPEHHEHAGRPASG